MAEVSAAAARPKTTEARPRLRLDVLSITGVALALVALIAGQWIEGGHIASLAQGAAFVIVLGGTVGAVMLQSPLPTFLRGVKLARWVVSPPALDSEAAIAQVSQWATLGRRHGMLMLEPRVRMCDDAFMRNGLTMLVDGFLPEKIRAAMEVEINAFEQQHRAAARVWEAAGGYAPTIGILGAVMGLIHVMENLSDPVKLGAGVAVAFVATVYGVALANLVFLPIAAKLRAHIHAQVLHRELILDGVLGIGNGEHPKLIEMRLRGYLA